MDATIPVTPLEELAARFPWLRDLDPKADWHICPEDGFLTDSIDSTTVLAKPGQLNREGAAGRLIGHIADVHPSPLRRGPVRKPRKRFGGRRSEDLLYVAYSFPLGKTRLEDVMLVERQSWERY